jgi:D-glycero-D-manno-heptose 1,7-bisphosphate phosphatase
MKLVLLDRDGVINVDRPNSVKSKEEFILIPNVIPAIRRLNDVKIPVGIVTNQAVVGRGEISEDILNEIHGYMNDLLRREGAFVDKIYVCTSSDPLHPHRKPNPGLLLEALQDFQVPPEQAVLIGDDLRDLQAARAINCPRILVRTGKGEKVLAEGLPEDVSPVYIVKDLGEAVTFILDGGI